MIIPKLPCAIIIAVHVPGAQAPDNYIGSELVILANEVGVSFMISLGSV